MSKAVERSNTSRMTVFFWSDAQRIGTLPTSGAGGMCKARFKPPVHFFEQKAFSKYELACQLKLTNTRLRRKLVIFRDALWLLIFSYSDVKLENCHSYIIFADNFFPNNPCFFVKFFNWLHRVFQSYCTLMPSSRSFLLRRDGLQRNSFLE